MALDEPIKRVEMREMITDGMVVAGVESAAAATLLLLAGIGLIAAGIARIGSSFSLRVRDDLQRAAELAEDEAWPYELPDDPPAQDSYILLHRPVGSRTDAPPCAASEPSVTG